MRKFLKNILPRNIKQYIYVLLEWICLPLLFLINGRSANNDSVALLRFDALGDFIVWLSIAREIRKMYSDKKIILVCAPTIEPLARQFDYFDEIVTVEIDLFNPLLMYHVYKKLNAIQAQVVMQFIHNRLVMHDFVAASIHATTKIALENARNYTSTLFSIDSLVRVSSRIYDSIVPVNKHSMHEIQIDALVLRSLGYNFISKAHTLPSMPIDMNIIPGSDYFLLSPGASEYIRCWDIDKFSHIAKYIQNKYHLKCCLCGSSNERHMADRIIENCNDTEIIDMVGHTNVLQLIEIVRAAKLVICNDTGIVHIAAAVSTPSVCIYGPWERGVFLPYDADDLSGIKQPMLCCKKMPCELCYSKYTEECEHCIKEYGKRLCVYIITEEEVKMAVDHSIIQNSL